MIKVRTEVLIRRPSNEVFEYVSNFENNPRWQTGISQAKFTTDEALTVGSIYEQVASFLGRKVVSTFRVIELVPGQMVKATTISGSFPITITRVVEPTAEGTRITGIIEGDASGFFRLAEPLLARLVQRSVDQDYARLKTVLESDVDSPGEM